MLVFQPKLCYNRAWETLLPFVETEHLEYLQQIHDAVVDLNQHSQFALIEPNRENH